MDTIKVGIDNIKNIAKAALELSIENGVYVLVGENGCGKSSILLCMSQLIRKTSLGSLYLHDVKINSKVSFSLNGINKEWLFDGDWKQFKNDSDFPVFQGLYEGSLFYGTRFNDSRIVDHLLQSGKIKPIDIVDSDTYIKDKLSYILHGDYKHYRTLKKIKNRAIAKRLNLQNNPYFNEVSSGCVISQYRMSSGECLLISLLHFIYNSLVRKSIPTNTRILMMIDEIELALHPVAVTRFIDLLNKLVVDHKNLTIYLTSHSPEVIKKTAPTNLYHIINTNGIVEVENNCYPSFLIRDLYMPDRFDYVLFVEDNLAKYIVENILLEHNLRSGKLVYVCPAGTWNNVLQVHKEFIENNILGVKTRIVSILDGDIREQAVKVSGGMKRIFLPIKSVEKFLYAKIIIEQCRPIMKILDEKYLIVRSVKDIIADFYAKYPNQEISGIEKKFYFGIKKDLENRNISEEVFLRNLCDDIKSMVDFSSFVEDLKKVLQ